MKGWDMKGVSVKESKSRQKRELDTKKGSHSEPI